MNTLVVAMKVLALLMLAPFLLIPAIYSWREIWAGFKRHPFIQTWFFSILLMLIWVVISPSPCR